MKKITASVLAVMVLSFVSMSFLSAEDTSTIQAIKKAVKENPRYNAGSEVKWFKVLITDTRTKKDKVKITLPILLIELIAKHSNEKNLKVNRDEYDIDLKELLAELKKLGPMALVEICEDDELVKVWLE
ncbi:MAG: hypothetical protein U9Q97_01235 [Acidobacteriota bacterium]|nr:hypothetical protein [Acidobacteriota bacterium]